MKESFQFIYRDARGNITLREVVSAIPVGDNYLQCWLVDRSPRSKKVNVEKKKNSPTVTLL